MAVALDGVSVWVADASGTVALARLAGPTGGVVRPPVHLVPAGLGPDWTCDLDVPADRARLYAECLRHGGVFDLCRWIDLDALLRVWPLLDLPVGVAGPWLSAFNHAGLVPAPMRSEAMADSMTDSTARRVEPAPAAAGLSGVTPREAVDDEPLLDPRVVARAGSAYR